MDEVLFFSQLYNEPVEKAARRVFLGGMSAGAMLSIYIQLTQLNVALGGVMLHSGYLL